VALFVVGVIITLSTKEKKFFLQKLDFDQCSEASA
jgi:hypothetical protein